MNQTERELLSAALRRDIKSLEDERDAYRRLIDATEKRLVRLRQLLEYANESPVEAHRQLPSAAPPLPPDASQPPSPGEFGPDDFTNADIVDLAERLLRHVRRPLRAVEIAKEIVVGYNPLKDSRNFENRVFTVLKRCPEKFERPERGLWVLKGDGAAAVNAQQNGSSHQANGGLFNGQRAEE